jgi:homocysteine S-methyltransferase
MIIDGGLGLELERRGFVFSTSLWSAQALITNPDLVTAIHRDYLDAGAEIIETATYQLSHAALRDWGYTERAIDALFERAVAIARAAIAADRTSDAAPHRRSVAGSLGPYGATQGDGSEYSGVQHLEPDALYAFHAERTRAMARARPDVVVFETIPSRAEALTVARVARDLGLRGVWLSLSCADGARTAAGDRVDEVVTELEAFGCIDVVGVNCTAPAYIASLVRTIRAATRKPIAICPNLGQQWASEEHALTGGASDSELLRHLPTWLELGVEHIGGCCGVGPATIHAITQATSTR